MSHSQNSLPVTPGAAPGAASPAPVAETYYEVEKGHNLKEYFEILIRRKWWVLGTVTALFLLAALYTFTRTPIYRATAIFEITNDNPAANISVGSSMMGFGNWFYAQRFQETQYRILQSRSLALRVIKRLNLEEHPDFKVVTQEQAKKSREEVEDLLFLIFAGNLSVDPVRNTYLVEVSYQSPDRNLAKKVLDAIPHEYMFLLIDRRNESYALVRNWLNEQLNEMAEKVHEAQKKLYQFGQKTNIYTLEEHVGGAQGSAISSTQTGNVIYQKFMDLSALLTKAQSETLAKKAQYEQIKSQGPNASVITNNPLITALRQEAVVQQAKVSGLERIYLPGHPELQAETAKLAELKNRLNAEVKRLQETVKTDYEAAERTEQLLRETLEEQKKQMATLQDNLSNYQILKRDALTNEQLYQALLARVKEANISSTMVPSNIAVIDPAPLPTFPYKPKVLLNLGLALVLGLIFGIGLALLVEAVDDSLKTIDDLERRCNLPLLGALPYVPGARRAQDLSYAGSRLWTRWLPGKLRRRPAALLPGPQANHDLTVFEQPQDPFSEAIRHLQTSIMLSVSGRPPAVIMITSPNPSEGKTLVANNLAISLALNGRSTVLVDCDLRKPRVHKAFQVEARPGLTNFLSGNAAFEEILRETHIPQLWVIPAGPHSPTPNNLLNSDIFKDLLGRLREDFAHILIDTPPVLGFSDARVISVHTDATILVTKLGVTDKHAIRLATQLLGQVNAPIMGGVVNCVFGPSKRYGAYPYYNSRYYSRYYREEEAQPS